MSTDRHHVNDHMERLLRGRTIDEIIERLRPDLSESAPKVPGAGSIAPDAVEARWTVLGRSPDTRAALAHSHDLEGMERYARNIENFIGIVKLPVGVAGPLRTNGLFAKGDYYVPLATTEAALVASYSRGAQVITESGGATAIVISEGVSRAPGFAFENLIEAGQFAAWAASQLEAFTMVTATTSRHATLQDLRITVEGNHVYLNFEFLTGDAAGQNMVTIATQAICEHIAQHSPVRPRYFFVEANLSGDKKATAQSFLSVRGRKVSAEVFVPAALLERRLHTTAARMMDYWRMSAMGGVLSGSIGVHGHYANGLAALYIACGQDAACVAESAVGVTRFEDTPDGGLYVAVTLPNLIVGTVGGGTTLPSQRACLDILGLAGPGHAHALAEVCAALLLAGELSITAALTSGHFTGAHQRLARGDAGTSLV